MYNKQMDTQSKDGVSILYASLLVIHRNEL